MKKIAVLGCALFAAMTLSLSCTDDPAANNPPPDNPPAAPTNYMSITINGVETTFSAGPTKLFDYDDMEVGTWDGIPTAWLYDGLCMISMKDAADYYAIDGIYEGDGLEIDISPMALAGDLSAPLTGEDVIMNYASVGGVNYVCVPDGLEVTVDKVGKNGEQVSGSFTATLVEFGDPEMKTHEATGKFSVKLYDPNAETENTVAITIDGAETIFAAGPSDTGFESLPAAWVQSAEGDWWQIYAMENATTLSSFLVSSDNGVRIEILASRAIAPFPATIGQYYCYLSRVIVGGVPYTNPSQDLSVIVTGVDAVGGFITGTFSGTLNDGSADHDASGSFRVKIY